MRRLAGFALPNSVRSVCSIKARVRCAPTMRNASDASAAAIHETVLECTRALRSEPLLDAQRVMGGIALSALPAHCPVTCFYYIVVLNPGSSRIDRPPSRIGCPPAL